MGFDPETIYWLSVMADEIDAAVCKTQENPFGMEGLHLSRLDFSTKEPIDGTAIGFTGFPQYITVPVTSRGHVASIGEFVENRRYILIDKTTWHGVSGGPLYLCDGTVIGIMAKVGENLWSGMGFAIPSTLILKFLRDKNIPVMYEQQQQQPKRSAEFLGARFHQGGGSP
jgi:Trypsin-like peptidase domain